ncbi:MAG TPA: type I-U CRISPR-associated protein Csb2 [bacterium]|nr:type I-U CRISPR-associated protein Csb2 [bacterium]
MIRYLLFSVRFLDDRYHGLTDNGESPEWPPSPFRLYQALVAGNARGLTLSNPLRDALRWLETLDPPEIMAPQARRGHDLLTYVPPNTFNCHRSPKMLHPMMLNGDRLVQYGWKFDASNPAGNKNADILIQAARHIHALGWGIDMAIGHGEIVEDFPRANESRVHYRAAPSALAGGIDLRVPRQHSLISLERTYADFLSRYETHGVTQLESAAAIYAPQRYSVGISRPHVAFRLVNADGDTISIRHQLIKQLVGMIRNLASQPGMVALLGSEVVENQVMGHPKQGIAGRVSILPLPTVREGPTDGRIRRVMVAQPVESDGSLIRLLGQILNGKKLCPLSDETRFPEIYLERIGQRDSVVPYYTGISKTWASVTPVLLPGFDDRKKYRGNHLRRLARAEQLVNKALRQAGIDVSASIELSRVPYWTGSVHALEYQPRDKLIHYPRWHVRLTFDLPLTGPLALGAGRHAGLGIFAAVPD